MSVPYFIHKDDADRYDAMQKERRYLKAQVNVLFQIEISKYTEKEYNDYPEEGFPGWRLADLWVTSQMEEFFQAINLKYNVPEIRGKSAFDKMSNQDYSNYYVYFLGWRCDDDFGVQMMGVAKDGIAKCKKAIGVK